MCSVVSLQFHVNVIIPRRNLRRLRSLEASLLSFVFAGGVLNSQGRDNPRTPPKKNHTKKTQKIHCPLLNLGLSNELLHVVLASLCILSPSAQFRFRAIKQRRNLQLTIFRFRRWCIKQPGTGQPQDPQKKNQGEAFPRPWAQQLEPGKKKDLRCFRTWAQQLAPVVD